MSKRNLISIFIIVVAMAVVIINFTSNRDKKNEVTDNASAKVEITQKETTTGVASTNVQYVAPDFELKTLNGQTVRLSDYQGKKVILNFWATWCPPCKAEMPHMQSFYEKYKHQGVEILAVNLTSQDSGVDKVQSFAKEYGLTFPVLLDEEGFAAQKYNIVTVPTSYMIDTEGTIVETVVGPMDETMMENLLKKADK